MELLTQFPQYTFLTLALTSQLLKGNILDITLLLNSVSPLPSNLPRQIFFCQAQMAPQTRSAARKQAALESSQRNDPPANIEPKATKDIPESENTPKVSKSMRDPFYMSKKRLDGLCRLLASFSDPPQPPARATRKHSDKLPTLLPAEMDYLLTLLVRESQIPPRQFRLVRWSAVTANFNAKFSKCHPRTEEVLKCAMRTDFYKVLVAVFRERCRKAGCHGGIHWDRDEHFG